MIECARCGIRPSDLPLADLGLTEDDAADFMFDHDGDDWFCQGCAGLPATPKESHR